jgi:hypothetical protein
MNTVEIRNLTDLEIRTLRTALETLSVTSPSKSTDRWASDVMLEDDAKFIKQLLWIEKGNIS